MALSHAQYRTALSAKLQSWLRRKARRLPEAWHEATLVLLRLDLDPARFYGRSTPLALAAGPPMIPSVCCGPSC
jgi:hypothetical protein